MTVSQMRQNLIQYYPGRKGWKKKVMAMPDRQVVAVHENFIATGKKPLPKPINDGRQASIFDRNFTRGDENASNQTEF